MRVLITGVTGFAGRHLADLCARLGHEVHGLVRAGREPAAPPEVTAHAVPLSDPDAVGRVLSRVRPERVLHLAGASSVGLSFTMPAETWDANLGGTLGVLEALRQKAPDTRALFVSSGEVYGRVPRGELPVGADTPLRPLSPYGASKAAADLAVGQYHDGYGLPVVRVRAFNHVGPGQDARFVLSNVAQQIATAERQRRDFVDVRVGNVETCRDFIDVRDMVRAYWALAEHGQPATTYLACSGQSLPVRTLVEGLMPLARVPVSISSDPALRRGGEQPDLYGDPTRLRADTGWAPEIPLETSLRDTLDWWRRHLEDTDR